MSAITQKQILQWKEELKNHKERLAQAQQVVEQETKVISMIEGGIQFGENLTKQIEQEDQLLNKEETKKELKSKQPNS
tara:strand:+ start:2109 stop:2342 length:234 start_codon:yes stop_codon:yes gene_type:complete